MKPIGIDCDDVIFEFAPSMHQCLSSRYAGIKPVSEWNTFFWSEINGIPYDSFIQHIIDDDLLNTCPVLPGAIEALHSIRDSGSPIVLITSRGYHSRAYEITHARLTALGAPFDDLVIVESGKTKAEATIDKYPNGFLYMIDDNAQNLDDMREAGLVKNPILIDMPWNQDRKDFKTGSSRFRTLDSFVNTLKKAALREDRPALSRDFTTVY